MSEVSQSVEIRNKLGLHARAAATLVRVTARFESSIKIRKSGLEVDGKSILGMMSLAAGIGTVLTITCEGPDQGEALEAIASCIEGRFGESE
ncbi:MAG: HPr family phosphocarrier protein [Myxococcota bacterium]|nr:HPr family phosphocarrier protein [Myxococcota bacterium]